MLTALTFAVALTTALLATPVVRGLAIRRGLLDHPGGRKIHHAAVPRVGGVAMVLAFFVALGGAMIGAELIRSAPAWQSDRVLAVVMGIAVLVVVGIVDDLRGMRARVKLLAQVLAAFVAWMLGLSIEVLHLPSGTVQLGVLALPVTLLWIVGILNAVNLIDGLDGLASGVVLAALGTFAVLAFAGGIDSALVITAAVSGAAVGFLAYNLHPASIIMGDTGSMFLGFVVAALAILVTQDGSRPVAPWIPILTLALPIVDTTWAIVRRLRGGGSVFEPDRGHVHHQLLSRGMSQRDAMLVLTACAAMAAIAAIVLARLG